MESSEELLKGKKVKVGQQFQGIYSDLDVYFWQNVESNWESHLKMYALL